MQGVQPRYEKAAPPTPVPATHRERRRRGEAGTDPGGEGGGRQTSEPGEGRNLRAWVPSRYRTTAFPPPGAAAFLGCFFLPPALPLQERRYLRGRCAPAAATLPGSRSPPPAPRQPRRPQPGSSSGRGHRPGPAPRRWSRAGRGPLREKWGREPVTLGGHRVPAGKGRRGEWAWVTGSWIWPRLR